jgi:hypothetical protein
LVERHIEGSNFKPRKWLLLFAHLVIAASLVALVAMAVHDSLTPRATLSEEEASPTSCGQPRLRS